MKKKGFTLVELLIVIAIIALLMGILMPTLSMVRKIAEQALCGTNLSGLYKAIQTYSTQYDEDYPKAGVENEAIWRYTFKWCGPTEAWAFSRNGSGQNYQATIGATLYLLIKYSDVGPKSFICRGDSGASVFRISDYEDSLTTTQRDYIGGDLTKAYDFGTYAQTDGFPPAQHYSYCYQLPYGDYRIAYYILSSASQPSLAVLADRNPYLALNPLPTTEAGYSYPAADSIERRGNSPSHDQDGQNVLYNNGSVTFQEKPYCGVNYDNIYTMDTDNYTTPCPQEGDILPRTGRDRCYNEQIIPQNGNDSLLLNEGENSLQVVH